MNDTISYSQIASILLAVTGTLAWAGLRWLWQKVEKLQTSQNEFQVHVATEYARIEHIGAMRNEIINHLQRIEDRLDRKADK